MSIGFGLNDQSILLKLSSQVNVSFYLSSYTPSKDSSLGCGFLSITTFEGVKADSGKRKTI